MTHDGRGAAGRTRRSGKPRAGDGISGGRLHQVREAMAGQGFDALVVTSLRNVRYLTGFSGSSGLAVITRRQAFLITDFRYRLQAARECRVEVVEGNGNPDGFLASFLRRLKPGRLGYENSTTVAFARRLRRAARPAGLAATDGLVERVRLVKDAGEAAVMGRLAKLAAKSFSEFMAGIRPGVTEREAALDLEWRLRSNGSDPPPFPIIVASGENGAMPHARAGERVIGEGDAVIVDFGAAGEGYASDMTRTFCLGEPPPDIAKAYRVVYDAQRSAIAAAQPGVRASAVDEAARSVIREAGLGGFFGHSTGHGVGLDVHEGPSLAPDSREVLRPGMVVTVEPGVYLEGRGGVRIEDMLLITENGHRVLTADLPRPRKL